MIVDTRSESDPDIVTTRLVIYAVSRGGDRIDDHVLHALEALRPHATRLVAVVPSDASDALTAALGASCDDVHAGARLGFDPAEYAAVIRASTAATAFDEVVLTGDSWFGPISDFTPVLRRMTNVVCAAWAMIENDAGPPETFPEAGFEHQRLPWAWTVLRSDIFTSGAWDSYWAAPPRRGDAQDESRFLEHLRDAGLPVAFAFPAAEFSSADPGLFTAGLLLEAGCPLLLRTVFLQYPPYLDRFAVIGRELLAQVEDRGFPMSLVWQNLARTVQPKALYAIGGMMEVLPDVDLGYDPERPFRLAVIVHASDLDAAPEFFARLANLPTAYDLFVTTTDGKRAEKLQRMLERREDPNLSSVDVRVTPSNRGRDMSDFFVGCRDVLLSGEYDLVIKAHARRTRDKTVNVRRYFRRYQYDNLLHSPGYVANLLAMFQREPGLGAVFPPMMHIGYSIMGNAWGGLRDTAEALARDLGITVPFDMISPLAPFGGMWIGRPEALAPLTVRRWQFRDYGKRTGQSYRNLARVQERLIAYAGAELGYHTRTVLTREHASISHTMLESKVDSLFASTRGWPVEQIALMQRAGDAGHLGTVALARMYIRLNHPRLSRITMPLFEMALRAVVVLKYARRGADVFTSVMKGRTPEARQ